ncbi:MAG: hypothetical protein M1352_01475 [Patescibacteria group bacterium]|nr:hypothetical protein [Patescibacteria group bacterium]
MITRIGFAQNPQNLNPRLLHAQKSLVWGKLLRTVHVSSVDKSWLVNGNFAHTIGGILIKPFYQDLAQT